MTGRRSPQDEDDEPRTGPVRPAEAQPAGPPEPGSSSGLPPRSRGVIGLLEENCTSCMLCARECPDWCIHIESHTEPAPPGAAGGRARSRPVLDRFAIDYSLCMYCGICIEVCPFDALFWSPDHAYAEGDVRDLVHERDRLREWVWTVPPPPAHDPAGEMPKELAVAEGVGSRPEGAGRAGHRSRDPGRRSATPEAGGAGAQPGDAPARPPGRGTAEGAAGDSGPGG